MITVQTIKAVLASGGLLPIELHENAPSDILVSMAYQPVARGVIPLLQWMPIQMPSGQRGLSAQQALQQAWQAVRAVASKHSDVVVGLEIDSYALLPAPDVFAITGALPVTQI